MHSQDRDRLIDRMVEGAAQRMARDIDQGILGNMLIESGWTPVNINPAFPEYGMLTRPYEDWYSRTAEWVHTNARGEYRLIKGVWIFQDPRDATLFILRWS
jgi:hypothetical protein